MCCSKKWVGGLAALALLAVGVGVLSQTEAGGWAKVQWQKVGAWFQKQVTPEDELARIANEIKDLDQDIDAKYDEIVLKQKQIENSAKTIEPAKTELAKQWRIINELKTAIDRAREDGSEKVSFDGKASDLALARKDLTARWEKFK